MEAAPLIEEPSTATAQNTTVFTDRSLFLTATGAVAATTIPSDPPTVYPVDGGFTSGSLDFTLVAGVSTRFETGDLSTRLPGNELAMSGFESFNVEPSAGTVFSFGFDFVEPQNDPNVNAPFEESTYQVTLLLGASIVDTFQFDRPNDSAQFVGVGTDVAFDRIEIREIIGNNENELFGQFYTGMTPIPEAGAVAQFMAGALGLGGLACRRSRRRR